MYQSVLLIDVGSNPDRPRPARQWLRNVYHVHQRLSMAFPTEGQRNRDPQFLQPFNPESFDAGRFLFRIDHGVRQNGPRSVILVQSAKKPDWDYAFQNAGFFLAAPPSIREFQVHANAGDTYRFRIRVNLCKKAKKSKDGADLTTPRPGVDAIGRARSQSKRVSLSWEPHENPEVVVREWFARKACRNGFELNNFQLVQMGRVIGAKPRRGAPGLQPPTHRMMFRAALLEGTLTVQNTQRFQYALENGIGPAKAFGFGLLSISNT